MLGGWEAKVDQRSRQKSRCPYFSGNRDIIGETDLATLMPELSKQWHPTKNLNLSPSQIKKSSNKKVWWLYEIGHEWESTIANRNNGNSYPHCRKAKLNK
ncbi:hypothetical protein COJ88_01275 [Bacillus cereus]|uniref:zinc-ribbon domain-containing protein n=1 Tax=Bacillus cereus TaxID=1396 RepID=UPI000BF6980A|nr:zinc-ribbon domain-containing protein [Bacillus cereus]PFP00442.1 hypothetical protein COJ88_01275 [Bacillus cereus]